MFQLGRKFFEIGGEMATIGWKRFPCVRGVGFCRRQKTEGLSSHNCGVVATTPPVSLTLNHLPLHRGGLLCAHELKSTVG